MDRFRELVEMTKQQFEIDPEILKVEDAADEAFDTLAEWAQLEVFRELWLTNSELRMKWSRTTKWEVRDIVRDVVTTAVIQTLLDNFHDSALFAEAVRREEAQVRQERLAELGRTGHLKYRPA